MLTFEFKAAVPDEIQTDEQLFAFAYQSPEFNAFIYTPLYRQGAETGK